MINFPISLAQTSSYASYMVLNVILIVTHFNEESNHLKGEIYSIN